MEDRLPAPEGQGQQDERHPPDDERPDRHLLDDSHRGPRRQGNDVEPQPGWPYPVGVVGRDQEAAGVQVRMEGREPDTRGQVLPLEQDMLRMRVPQRRPDPLRPRVDMPRMRDPARPRQERLGQHPQGRAEAVGRKVGRCDK